MPALTDRELRRLIDLYLQAETDIINEIGRLRSLGLVDYHAEAALERVQKILRKLENDCWTYVPRMIETQFYVHHPEARKPLEEPETPAKHLLGYKNARALTGEQLNLVQLLTTSAMATLTEANVMAARSLEEALLGRREDDIFRRVGMERTALMQATGRGVYKSLPEFVAALRRDGVTAFTDKAGRHWNLHTYGSMVLRTTSRQAEVLSILTESPDHDLFQISKHGTTCKVCAPLEGRVYSKSGTDPDFPPLAAAFGKIDRNGPDTLENSWLNLHPNCLHQLRRWTPMGRSEEEIRKIKDFSSFEKNPVTRDPRTKKQIEAYRKKEASRRRWLADHRQWVRYRETVGDPVPKTFETFRKHKKAGSEKFTEWKKAYRQRNDETEKIQVEQPCSGEYNQEQKAAIRSLIRSDQVTKRINKGHQDKHIKASGHYVPGKSYLYGDLDTAQALVDQYHGTGEPIFTRQGDWAKKEVVSSPEPIGVDVDMQTGAETDTCRFTIHYGKKGTHVVPAREKSP